MSGAHTLFANRAADAGKGRGMEIEPGLEAGRRVLDFRSDPFTSLRVNMGPGMPAVTLTTSQGSVQIPGFLAQGIVEKVVSHRREAVEQARENFGAVVANLKTHIAEIFSDPAKKNRYGPASDNHQGYAEVPGERDPGAKDYVRALRNPSGTGSIVEGRVAGVAFSIEPWWNPSTKQQDLVLKAERYVDVDANFGTELHGADALAVFDQIRGLFKGHPKIGTQLEVPKAR